MDLQNRTQEVREILARSHSAALSHEERTENERRLAALLEEDILAILQILIFIVVAPDNDQPAPGSVSPQAQLRELASIVFKNAVFKRAFVAGAAQLGSSDWFGVEATVRAQIKEALLSTLGADANASWKATKDVCLCLAAVAVVEVPTGHWPDCVALLAGQAGGDSALTFRMAAVHTLGLMQDSLLPSDLPPADVERIWAAMLGNVGAENLELAKIAAKAIARLAPATAGHFENEAQRGAIMAGIFNLLEIQDDDVLQPALDALIEIAALNYQYMGEYLNPIRVVTERLLATQDQHQSAGYSVEVWTTLFEAEARNDSDSAAETKYNIIRNSEWTRLATLFLNGLSHTGYDEGDQNLEDETDASLSLACATALAGLAAVVKDDLVQVSFQYVSQLLESQQADSWTATYIALTALNGTVAGPSEEILKANFGNTLDWVYGQASSNCQRVRCAAVILLSQLATQCPSLIVASQDTLAGFMRCFQNGFKPEEHFRITVHAMQAAQNLYVSLAKREGGQVKLLNDYFTDIMNISISKILDKAFIQQGMVTAAQDCVNDIAQNCDNDNLKDQLLNLCDQVCQQIEQIIAPSNNQYNDEEVEQLVNNFGGLMQVLVVRLDSNLPPEMQQRIYTTITNVCAKDSCRQGVLLMLNGLLNIMEQDNISSIALDITKVIQTTIQGQGCNGDYPFDPACQRMATGLIQDLTTGLKEGIADHLQPMMEILICVLEDAKFDTEVKTIAIIAIGDLCLMTEAGFQPYFAQAMNTLIQAGMMAVAEINPNLPPEDRRHVHLLRQSLVDAFMSIINGIKSPSFNDENTNSNNQNQAAPNQFDDLTFEHIRNMFFYLEKLVSMDDLEIDCDLARQILDLYCDIVMLQTFDPQMAQSQVQHDKITTFTDSIRKSACHNQIQRKFNPYVPQINALDKGEAVARFQEIVATRVLNQ